MSAARPLDICSFGNLTAKFRSLTSPRRGLRAGRGAANGRNCGVFVAEVSSNRQADVAQHKQCCHDPESCLRA
jgi:hypothetical protein